MAEFPFTREELESMYERAMQHAHDEDDAGIRTALQTFGEAAKNLSAKLPGARAPDPFEDPGSA